MADGLDCELADDIPECNNDKHSQPPESDIFPKTGAPIDNTVQIQSIDDGNWNPHAQFATPHQWQLCRSIVDTNLG